MASGILFCAGLTVDEKLLVRLYDVEKNEWQSEIFFPDIQWNDILPFDNKIYFIKRELDFEADKFEIEIRSYDLTTKELTLNTAYTKQYAGKAVGIYKNCIYFLNILDNFISRYNLIENSMEENVASLKECHEENTAFLNGLLYIVGVRFSNYHESDCTTYDTVTHEVKSIAPHPALPENPNQRTDFRNYGISVTRFDGKLYTIEDGSLKSMYVYDPDTNEWQTLTIENPPEINKGMLTRCGGKLLCVSRNIDVFVFDSESNDWKKITEKYEGAMTHVIYTTDIDNSVIND